MSTSTLTKAQIAGAKRSKQYKALIAVGLDEDTAMKAYQREVKGIEIAEPEPETPDPVAALVAAGFSEAEARRVLAESTTAPEPASAPVVVAEPLTPQDVAEQLVAQQGLSFTKGRVYITTDMIEAAVRVRKTGSPEIVTSAGVGRTAAVLLFKGEAGTVALQNLTKASA